MLLQILLSLLALLLVVGAALLGVYVGDWFGGILLTAFVAWVVARQLLPMIWLLTDAGSIRQAKKAVQQARAANRPYATLAARARLALVRWQRRT